MGAPTGAPTASSGSRRDDLSTTAVRAEAPSRRAVAWSAPTRLAAALSGTPALIIKIAFLAVVNAIAVYAATVLADDEKWAPLAVLAVVTAAIDVIYLWPGLARLLPLKFLIPGTIFLVAFQIIPVGYTINVGFTNYSTGHLFSKSEAITAIQKTTLEQPADAKTYTMTPAKKDGDLVLILRDDADGKWYVGTEEGLEALPPDAVQETAGLVSAVEGYAVVKGPELLRIDRELAAYTVPTEGAKAIRPEGLGQALELEPTLRYDARTDRFVRISDGKVFTDNQRGSFVSADGRELEPGWKTYVGGRNFRRVVDDPLIRDPFLRVLLWTVVFAACAVVLSFFLGLFLAITLDRKMRFQRLYRSALVIPYAVPSFLTLLVWQGLLNDEFGIVNRTFGLDVPWLFDPWWARLSVVLVSVWLTFPYFFLVSLGALQSIPGELVEAARVDGAGAWQVFRKITLPLLLVAVAPLMIASFAFNFNNFNNIYLLTAGGPASEDQSVAGATDILISYTYKLAFESGKGNDYGLASAISIFIFFIVASISALAFWRSRTLENIR
ncbi:MAG: ABC transporter permease subunit [Thermoleophilia bacterium]|nr:ABC transporter permease subunit [Thermoleophilia bacterium]